MNSDRILFVSRRQLIRGLLAATAFGVTTKFGAGCAANNSSEQAGAAGNASPEKQTVVGFIYVGSKNDFGYNQGHAIGAAALAAKYPWIKLVEQENVPETTAVAEAMRDMIDQDDAQILFPTSFGYYDPHILKIAPDYPEVQFFHNGAVYKEGVDPKNVGSFDGYIYESQYVAGVAAGLTSKTGKLGFVGAKPIPSVLRNLNSFALGARSVKPETTVQAVFTGNWTEPIKEAEAVNSMVDQGIDVVSCHVDSPKVVIETAEKRGIFSSGYHTDQSSLAPKGFLTAAVWDWATFYTRLLGDIHAGKSLMKGDIPHMMRGGIQAGYCTIAPYGPAVSAETKQTTDAVLAKLKQGNLDVFSGEIKDNQGKVVIPAGKALKPKDPILEGMNFLVEGVIGSVGS